MDTQEAVRRFVLHARDRAGGSDELGQAMEPFYGRPVPGGTVRGWVRKIEPGERGPNDPGGQALFAMLRAFPDLSLDEYALAEDQVPGLQARIKLLEARAAVVQELHDRMIVLQDRLDEVLEAMGRAPLEFPGA